MHRTDLFVLRDYQLEGCNKTHKSWQTYDRTLLVLPTAAGKTIVFSSVAATRLAVGKVLILAHRDELIDQAREKLYRANGLKTDKEKGGENASLNSPVVVASVQTLSRLKRLHRFPADHFQTVIVDEAHHGISESYQRVLSHFPRAKVLGVTATPDRGDKRSLGTYFQDIAHEVGMVELIKRGFLAPITVQNIPVKIDISDVRVSCGDFSEADLGDALEPMLGQVAAALKEYAADRKTLVFVPLVRNAVCFAEILRETGFSAEYVSGKCADRASKLARFVSGETRVLVNSMLLTEGYDEPSIDCVVVLRPTKSRPLLAQMVGRGTRIHPGKRDLLLLDFLWLTSRHNLIRPASLIAKDDQEAAAIQKHLADCDGDLVEAQDAVQRDRDRALAAAIRANRERKARRLDIMQLEIGLQAPGLSDFQPTMGWHHERPSEKQLAYIERSGVDTSQIRGRGEASAIIDVLEKRRNLNLASWKQVRLMIRLGHETPHMVTFQEAGAWIDQALAQQRSGGPGGRR
jgi:superfamily II DNA or RNA helicase